MKDFLNVTSAENFDTVNHNDRDYDAFKTFQENINKRFETIEKERSLRERKNNVITWDKSLPNRWVNARLSRINNPAARKAQKIIQNKEFSSIFITGEAGSGKTFLSYAIARRFIEKGWVTPSEIKIISEENLMSVPKMGFAGQANLEKIFQPQYKLYIFDNAGSRSVYDSKEGAIWEQLIDHIYTNSLVAVFTRPSTPRSFSDNLTDTASSKLKHLVNGKIIYINNKTTQSNTLGEYSEEEKQEQRMIEDKVNAFKKF